MNDSACCDSQTCDRCGNSKTFEDKLGREGRVENVCFNVMTRCVTMQLPCTR